MVSLGTTVTTVMTVMTVMTYAATSEAASPRRTDFPCPGCVTDLPAPLDTQKKTPLLVLLHGDGQGPLSVAPLFAKEAAARGWALFVPKCPKAEGCNDARWWSWGKDPAWFDAQIAAIDAVLPLDHDRLWLAGWSGGSSYIGWVAPALAGRFAAVSVNGGGMPPSVSTCPTTCALPVYFLVGDKNPLHALAVDLRDWFAGCKEEVVWDLQKGQDHGGEWLEISKPNKIATIADWLEKHPRSCKTGAETETGAETGTGAGAETGAETEAGAAGGSGSTIAPAVSPSAPPPAATPGRCGCGVSRPRSSTALLSSFALLAAAALRRFVRGARRA